MGTSFSSYAGYYYDVETEQYYLQARYYDPETARFISRDPDGGDRDNPMSQNLYVYGNGDPVNNVDPDGEFAWAASLYFVPGIGHAYAITVLAVVSIGLSAYAAKKGYKLYKAKKTKARIPLSEPNIKGQGRERIQKKRKNPNWEDRSNKPVNRPLRPKSHTPGRGHKKFKK